MNQTSVSDLVLLMGSVFGISFSMLLFLSKRNHRAKRYLSLLLLVTGVSIFMQYLMNEELYLSYPHIIKANYPVNFLFGPLLYLFTSELTEPVKKHPRRCLHFLPFFTVTLLMALFYYGLEGAAKLQILQGEGDRYFIRPIFSLFQPLLIPYGMTYIILSLIKSRSYQRRISQYFSRIEEINLKWLNRIILTILLTWILSALSVIIRIFNIRFFDLVSINGLAGIILIYVLAYLMMRQPDLFKYLSQVEELSQDSKPSTEKAQRYKNLNMDESRQKEIYQGLITALEQKRIYLNPDLTVKELAEIMDISSSRLSMVISSQSDYNFYSLVNTFRVEEAKKLLVSDEHRNRNILDTAHASGFNSKSVFNSYFKKISGITPLQYKKAHSAPLENNLTESYDSERQEQGGR